MQQPNVFSGCLQSPICKFSEQRFPLNPPRWIQLLQGAVSLHLDLDKAARVSSSALCASLTHTHKPAVLEVLGSPKAVPSASHTSIRDITTHLRSIGSEERGLGTVLHQQQGLD